MIREGLLDSEKVLSVPADARWLFVAIQLTADDLGLFEATEFRLHRKAALPREHVGKLLAMLADVDLVRLYEAGGRTLGFIPKFGQRLRIKSVKYPMPPRALVADDEDALNKIKHLGIEMPDTRPSLHRQRLSESESESEAELEKSNTVSPAAAKKQAAKPEVLGKPLPAAKAPAAAPKGPRAAKPPDEPTPGSLVFDAYKLAYRKRYKADPVRNQKVNSQCKQLAERLGIEAAPQVAAFFVAHNGNLYKASGHATDLLLRDAESLHTQWVTNTPLADRTQTAQQVNEAAKASKLAGMTGGRLGNPAIGQTIDMETPNANRPLLG
jgi:hypothetical protein